MNVINVIHGDGVKALEAMEENQYDLAIVDAPYGLERFKKGIGKNDRHKVKATSIFNNGVPTDEYWGNLFRVSDNQIVWGANNFVMPPSEYFCIWNKKQTVDNFASAEYAWVSMGLKKPAKVFDYGIHKHNQTNKIHPTQKPVALYKWLLKNYAKNGDRIVDNYGGSMSHAIACIDMGFSLDIYEIDDDYYKSAVERIKRHLNQLDLSRPPCQVNFICK